MAALERDLRKQLENTVRQARRDAEAAAQAALNVLGAQLPDAPTALDGEARNLRTALRARAKALGDGNREGGWQPLIEEIAYEQWHQLLFARFLAENGLLMHPEMGVSVSLDECAELAPHEGAEDGWRLAARYAAAMLPGLFRADDPAVRVRLAPEGRVRLERLVTGLPVDVFTADDALGWVYQYWQADRKDEVNRSGRKIGAAELSPVTQLFTEDYMVRSLLENSLGAWWAGRHPCSPLLQRFAYLRYRDDGTPAAGTFPGWPATAAEVTIMDPCCGSGHFLVAAFDMLREMRMEEEGLSEAKAGNAVLRDNLHGLELDARCVQIATFAVALAAWKAGGYRELPAPKIACSGVAVKGQLDDWLKLAKGDERLRAALTELHALFREAPTLGSLIDPKRAVAQPTQGQQRLLAHEWERLEGVIGRVLEHEAATDPALAVLGHDVESVTKAASLLNGEYTLVATNVPYKQSGELSPILTEYFSRYHSLASADIATVFIERCIGLCRQHGALGVVSPQNWLYQNSYIDFRMSLLTRLSFRTLTVLSERAFESKAAAGAFVSLTVAECTPPRGESEFWGIDASQYKTPNEKSAAIRLLPLVYVEQSRQRLNPDQRILLDYAHHQNLLSDYAYSYQGLKTGDDPRYRCFFWEVSFPTDVWRYMASTVRQTMPFGGFHSVLRWEEGTGSLSRSSQARVQGRGAWNHLGVAVSQMRSLPVSLYSGEIFDSNVSALVPKIGREHLLPAIWTYCSSSEFYSAVRQIDPALKPTNSALVQIPFDVDRWQRVANERFPMGLTEPYSDDPTQWLFKGEIVDSSAPLQVAVARLLGYRWPDQEPDPLDAHADPDGIVPLPALRTDQSAAERLRALLAEAYGDAWSTARQDRLLDEVGFGGRDLAAWLADRNGFFAQHCALFHQRPFIWHIWDGARDGFSALVNYHKLTPSALDRLIYSYLGDWIATQRQLAASGEAGAEARLAAALGLQQKLLRIREGKPPYDIYVRWKPLHEQPIGWVPDLDDGVRLNIRPFLKAQVLRVEPNVKWTKDGGSNKPGTDELLWAAEAQGAAANRSDLRSHDGSERLNDVHFDLETKRAARQRHAERQPAGAPAS